MLILFFFLLLLFFFPEIDLSFTVCQLNELVFGEFLASAITHLLGRGGTSEVILAAANQSVFIQLYFTVGKYIPDLYVHISDFFFRINLKKHIYSDGKFRISGLFG